jgi:hypothetical protein
MVHIPLQDKLQNVHTVYYEWTRGFLIWNVQYLCASIHAGPYNWTYVFSALLFGMAIPAYILAVSLHFQCNELKDLSVISIFLDVVPQTSHKIPLFHIPCLAICMHMYMRQNMNEIHFTSISVYSVKYLKVQSHQILDSILVFRKLDQYFL